MKIAIDASPAFLHLRTGIEEYSYQLIRNLRKPLREHNVTLYIRGGTRENIDFDLPLTWRVKELRAPRFWTYGRLSLELLFHRYDRFFVPGHIVPPIHPRGTVMVVHGLEYERTPEAYSQHERRAMRFGIRKSCKWARRIICVSNNTKKDLMDLYDVSKKKIRVIYHGVNPPIKVPSEVSVALHKRHHLQKGQYLLFIGRLEHRKNIIGILKAYEILKEHFRIPHKLVLAGKGGHGWEEIQKEIAMHTYRDDIVIPGFVSSQEKWALLRGASVFLFPSQYEGFGLPVLEAQQVGVPVVTSKHSSLKEVAQGSALYVNPGSATDIAGKTHELLTNEKIYNAFAEKGLANTKRFSWERAARLTAKMILAK